MESLEQIGYANLMSSGVRHTAEMAELIGKTGYFTGIESKSRRCLPDGHGCSVDHCRTERHYEEIELVAGIEQDVILTGVKGDHIASRDGYGPIPNAHHSLAAHNQVNLGFFVKVARPVPLRPLRLISPNLCPSSGGHGEGLEDRGYHPIRDSARHSARLEKAKNASLKCQKMQIVAATSWPPWANGTPQALSL